MTVALALLAFCPDTPTGKWSERGEAVRRRSASAPNQSKRVSIGDTDLTAQSTADEKAAEGDATSRSPQSGGEEEREKKKRHGTETPSSDHEAQVGEQYEVDAAQHEVIIKPTWEEALKVVFSPQTLVLGACYFSSFGAELAVNSILGSYYSKNIPTLSLQGSGNWAAMFVSLHRVSIRVDLES